MAQLLKALTVAVGALLLLAPAGLAQPGKHRAKPAAEATGTATSTASGTGSIASATATCPKGTLAVAGGFEAPSSSEVLGLVYESVKTGPRTWRASAQLLDIGNPSSLTLEVSVYCKRKFFSARTRRVNSSTDGTPHLGPLVRASCRRSQVAVAGGFSMAPPLHDQMVTALVLDSRRDGPQAWNTFLATGGGGSGAAATEVYCARKQRELAESVAGSAPSAGSFETLTATANCGGDKRPTSGGFAQPQSDVNSFIIVFQSERVGDGWKVSGLHSGMEPPVTLNALAYC
jgi:hypothetical protein